MKKKKVSITMVVLSILVFSALAFVIFVALLADASPGKGSSATTLLRNAITSVRATQTGLATSEDPNFAGINKNALSENDPDINWVSSNLTDESEELTVALIEMSDTKIVMQTTDSKTCFFAELNAEGPVRNRYGTSGMKDGICPSTAGVNGGNDFTNTTSDGWK